MLFLVCIMLEIATRNSTLGFGAAIEERNVACDSVQVLLD